MAAAAVAAGNGSRARTQITAVYKFGGSSVADATRMCTVADIVTAFPGELPCVVLSAMGRSTNLLLEAGEAAIAAGADGVSHLSALRALTSLHREAAEDLAVGEAVTAQVEKLLTELQQLLIGVAIMQARAHSHGCITLPAERRRRQDSDTTLA